MLKKRIIILNNTLSLLSEFAGTPRTEELIERLDSISDEYKCGEVMVALIHLLITGNMNSVSVEDAPLDTVQVNVSLTELFQAMRIVSDNMLDHDCEAEGCGEDDFYGPPEEDD